MRTRAANDAADQVGSHSSILSAQFAWQGLKGLQVGWVLASPVQFCQSVPLLPSDSQVRSSSKLAVGLAPIAGWKANGEVHAAFWGGGNRGVGLRGVEFGSHVAILGVDQGDFGSR